MLGCLFLVVEFFAFCGWLCVVILKYAFMLTIGGLTLLVASIPVIFTVIGCIINAIASLFKSGPKDTVKPKCVEEIERKHQLVSKMTGVEFEEYACELLEKNGYKDVHTTPRVGDNGADIFATKDDKEYVIQCKRYSETVGNSAVQEAYAAKGFYDKEVAVVLTNSKFSSAAELTAKKLDVILWNGQYLEYLIQNAIRLSEEVTAETGNAGYDSADVEDLEFQHYNEAPTPDSTDVTDYADTDKTESNEEPALNTQELKGDEAQQKKEQAEERERQKAEAKRLRQEKALQAAEERKERRKQFILSMKESAAGFKQKIKSRIIAVKNSAYLKKAIDVGKTVLGIIYVIAFWLLSLLMAFFAIVAIYSSRCINGLLFLATAVAINPVVGDTIRKKLFNLPKWAAIFILVIGFFLALYAFQ